jgi:type III secretion protein Q
MINPLAESAIADVAHAEPRVRLAHAARNEAIAPLRLRDIGRTAARTVRTLSDKRLAARAKATLGVSELHVKLADPRALKAAEPAVIELSFAAPTGQHRGTVYLGLDLQTYPALAIAAWPKGSVPATPNYGVTSAPNPGTADLALRNAVAGVLLEPLLEQLGRFGLADPRVISVRRQWLSERQHELQQSKRVDAACVALSFSHHAGRREVMLLAEPACYDALDALLHATPATSFGPGEWQADLQVPGQLIIGIKPIAVDTLAALEPGDVLLRGVDPSFAAAWLAGTELSSSTLPRAVASWGTPGLTRLTAEVDIDGRSLVIVKEPTMSEELYPASTDAGLATDQASGSGEVPNVALGSYPIHIGELELPVQFEIDTVAMPLAQLSALGPGYVVELPMPVDEAQLRLVAHGQTIGYGELVTVGEHLGVRIIRMAHRHGSVQ